ncbi:DUF4123 domain-containing protein [Paraburkholderia bonniea]|uniref:DUF4123 domain-containing protein n=1 Tax=Paraburkholderia bonniea TaxID=2152891 RepID=UPI002572C433|nr:DUF4123 domain-containing protein [Paraburkholderia bonniea]WJF90230.1 DUF4123 domain-containing protein [Paraburkholderia bonniea]WJF93544.1 DUF4123 domain-containing protein [Paraburkholderia bonniea]
MRFHQKLDRWGMRYQSLFHGHAEASLMDIAPLLIDVSEDHEASQRVMTEATRLGKLKPCVHRLEASSSLKQLAEHFSQFHLVTMPHGRMMVMRWYDTRILPTWLDVLHDDQRHGFMEPVTAWGYFDRYGEYQQLDIPVTSHSTPASMELPLELDHTQSSALFAASEPDALIAQLRKLMPDDIKRIPYTTLHPFVSEQWQAAYQHGLSASDDHLLYVLLALQTSGRFIEHPDVKHRLAEPADQHPQPFSPWLDSLPDNVWEIGQPLWANATHQEET